MKRREFLKEYNINEEHEEWFLSNRALTLDLKVMGWKLKDYKPIYELHKSFNELDIICTNPNFYKDGDVIANSRKSEIMASGIIKIIYEGVEYTDINVLLEQKGVEALKELNNIEWNETMDWIIVDKKTGNLMGQFDNWDECPQRKEVE